MSNLRFIHGFAEKVDVWVNKQLIFGGLEYQDVTRYFAIDREECLIQIIRISDSKEVAWTRVVLKPDKYSVLLTSHKKIGDGQSIGIISDNIPKRALPFVYVRFYSLLAMSVDVYIDGNLLFTSSSIKDLDCLTNGHGTVRMGWQSVNVVDSFKGDRVVDKKMYVQEGKNVILILMGNFRDGLNLIKISD